MISIGCSVYKEEKSLLVITDDARQEIAQTFSSPAVLGGPETKYYVIPIGSASVEDTKEAIKTCHRDYGFGLDHYNIMFILSKKTTDFIDTVGIHKFVLESLAELEPASVPAPGSSKEENNEEENIIAAPNNTLSIEKENEPIKVLSIDTEKIEPLLEENVQPGSKVSFTQDVVIEKRTNEESLKNDIKENSIVLETNAASTIIPVNELAELVTLENPVASFTDPVVEPIVESINLEKNVSSVPGKDILLNESYTENFVNENTENSIVTNNSVIINEELLILNPSNPVFEETKPMSQTMEQDLQLDDSETKDVNLIKGSRFSMEDRNIIRAEIMAGASLASIVEKYKMPNASQISRWFGKEFYCEYAEGCKAFHGEYEGVLYDGHKWFFSKEAIDKISLLIKKKGLEEICKALEISECVLKRAGIDTDQNPEKACGIDITGDIVDDCLKAMGFPIGEQDVHLLDRILDEVMRTTANKAPMLKVKLRVYCFPRYELTYDRILPICKWYWEDEKDDYER